MTKQEFKNNLTALVERYIASSQSYDDNPQIEISIADLTMALIDGEEIGDEDANDYYPVMDLICFSPLDPSKAIVLSEAVDEVADQYFEVQESV